MAINLHRKGAGLSGADRNKENENLTLIEQEFARIGNVVPVADDAKATAESAVQTASAAELKATSAVEKADNVQTQLDVLVVEGDSSPQATQASVSADGTVYPSLKARLDAEQQTAAALLAEKANEAEVRKNNIPIGLNDAATDLLQALFFCRQVQATSSHRCVYEVLSG